MDSSARLYRRVVENTQANAVTEEKHAIPQVSICKSADQSSANCCGVYRERSEIDALKAQIVQMDVSLAWTDTPFRSFPTPSPSARAFQIETNKLKKKLNQTISRLQHRNKVPSPIAAAYSLSCPRCVVIQDLQHQVTGQKAEIQLLVKGAADSDLRPVDEYMMVLCALLGNDRLLWF